MTLTASNPSLGSSPAPSPNEKKRIVAIDVLRGFALLGILIMNIQSFSMISTAYFNPTAYGDLTGVNFVVWLLSSLFADQKFMTLFSLLFGAGIVLMTSKIDERGGNPLRFHYQRTFWLMMIGLAHAYLLWFGDILVTYALCAFMVVLARQNPPQKLFRLGVIMLLVGSSLFVFFGLTYPQWPAEQQAQEQLKWQPDENLTSQELNTYRGGWLDQMEHRVPNALMIHSFVFAIWGFWRASGLMLIGMALFKWGILSAQGPTALYRRMVGLGFIVGLPLTLTGTFLNFKNGWTYGYSMFLGSQFNYWASLFVAAAYIGLVMLVVQARLWPSFQARLAAVGRMALTNYLLQTVIATSIFYGHGLGLFGFVPRWGQALIVLAIWIFQIWLSLWWLTRFRFGPTEWVWRSLTYGRRQPMRR